MLSLRFKVTVWLWITVALQLSIAYAQLTSPDAAVCVGKQVVFSCQQDGGIGSWTVELLLGRTLFSTLSSSQSNRIASFLNDDFGFKIHILPESTPSSVHSDLRVTAVRQLHGVRVVCQGSSGTFNSTIQVASVDPPPAPSDVSKIENHTRSVASITLSWSVSSGVANYTITVTPESVTMIQQQRVLFTSTESVQIEIPYNQQYLVNITAQNCAGRNSTVLPILVDGCSPPSPLANGTISGHSSGAVGAMLTFQCDAGYMPQEGISSCLSNTSWVPVPHCKVIDCSDPIGGNHVIIESFNDTKLDAVVTFRCKVNDIRRMAVCGSNGEWIPNLTSFECETIESYCRAPIVPANGHINNYSSTVDGSQITFHCGGDSPVMTSTCSNGSWIPDPAYLVCNPTSKAISQVIIASVICSLVFFILGMLTGFLCYHLLHVCKFKMMSSKNPKTPAGSAPVVYEEVSCCNSHSQRKNDIELQANAAYGPVEDTINNNII